MASPATSRNPEDPNKYSYPFQLTKTMHRQPYERLRPVNPPNSQNGKIVIITGAYGVIGKSVARVWTRAGASVVLVGERGLPLARLAQDTINIATNPSAKVIIFPLDITSEAEVRYFYDRVLHIFKKTATTLVHVCGVNGETGRLGKIAWDSVTKVFNTQYLGAALMSKYFIANQPDPENPVGTIINITSALTSMVEPGFSSYSIAKLAGMRLMEFLDAEYPLLRTFSLLPGILSTGSSNQGFSHFARDHVDMAGLWTVYLSQRRADYLRGGLVGVNWDIDELEQHREEIVRKRLLKLQWVAAKMGQNGHPWETKDSTEDASPDGNAAHEPVTSQEG